MTIVTQERKKLFGEVVDGEMILNDIGLMVKEVWEVIPDHFPNVDLGVFVVMRNHVHGIINITEMEATRASPLLIYFQHLLSMTLIVGVRPRDVNIMQRPQGGLIPTYEKMAGFTSYVNTRGRKSESGLQVIRNTPLFRPQ